MRCSICKAEGKHFPDKICPKCREIGIDKRQKKIDQLRIDLSRIEKKIKERIDNYEDIDDLIKKKIKKESELQNLKNICNCG